MAYILKHVLLLFFVSTFIVAHADQNPPTKPPPKEQAAPPQSNPSTSTTSQTDILEIAKLVLDTSKTHVEEMRDHFESRLEMLGAIAAGIAFIFSAFGIRTVKGVLKPIEDKMIEFTKITGNFTDELFKFKEEQTKHWLDFNAKKATAWEELQAEMKDLLHNNAKAQVAITEIFNRMEKYERLEKNGGENNVGVLKEIIYHADRVLPKDYPSDRLDNYSADVLRITKAWALKRSKNFKAAYECAKAVVESGRPGAEHETWVYNAACYAALAGQEEHCLVLLAKAVRLNPEIGGDAANDDDFEKLKSDENFWRILGKKPNEDGGGV